MDLITSWRKFTNRVALAQDCVLGLYNTICLQHIKSYILTAVTNSFYLKGTSQKIDLRQRRCEFAASVWIYHSALKNLFRL
jgi:hypothetical protein